MNVKRTSTEPGMGAVRGAQKSARSSRRAPPLSCPTPRVPQVEDVGTKRTTGARRSTIGRENQTSDRPNGDAIGTPSFAGRPKLTAKAAKLTGLDLRPRDAFILSRIDGALDADDLADLTGVASRDVVSTLERLAALGLITIG